MDLLGSTKVFVIPKKNVTLNVSQKWKSTVKEFVEDTMNYLEQYHQEGNSESRFVTDKKKLG
jgi:transposase